MMRKAFTPRPKSRFSSAANFENAALSGFVSSGRVAVVNVEFLEIPGIPVCFRGSQHGVEEEAEGDDEDRDRAEEDAEQLQRHRALQQNRLRERQTDRRHHERDRRAERNALRDVQRLPGSRLHSG